MDNLHNRLKVELDRKNEIFHTTVKKSILKLVELQSLVAKCYKYGKNNPPKFANFLYISITRGKVKGFCSFANIRMLVYYANCLLLMRLIFCIKS